MKFTEESVVSAPLSTFLHLSRVAGISPLHMMKTENGFHIRFSTIWAVYGYIIITVINAITIVQMLIERDDYVGAATVVRAELTTQRVVGTVQTICMVLISGAAVYRAPVLIRSMIPCLNQMLEINRELSIHHWPKCMERNVICLIAIQAFVCVTLSVLNCVQVLLTTLQLKQQTWVKANMVFYFISYWIVQARASQFIIFVLHVKYSFVVVNENFTSMLKVINNSKHTLDHMAIKRLSVIFSALCDVVREVNRSHGPMVLMILANVNLHLICTPYSFIIYAFDDQQDIACFTFVKILIQLLWCLFHIFNLATIVEPCHFTHVEMMKTRELIIKMMHHTRSNADPLAIELERFLRNMALNQVYYEPLKIIKMSRILIFTVLGSVTTYTVFILHL